VALAFAVAVGADAQQGAAGGRAGGGRRPGGGEGGLIAVAAVEERVVSSPVAGRLRPANAVIHAATATGTVVSVEVRVGQAVRVGQPLLTVERTATAGSFRPVVVTARIAGTVSSIAVKESTDIRDGQDAVTVIDTSALELTAAMSDKDAFRVDPGLAVSARTNGGTELSGVLATRSPEPDYTTGLYTATFRFPAASEVRPGQFVVVDVPVETASGIFIPQDLLVRRYGRFFVWVLADDDTLSSREVVPGRTFGSDVLIQEGLEPGDRYPRRLTGREREGAPLAVPGR
jgi:multidrug efflux pump subunit AcrA (membrane-fusion protein)